MVCLNIKFARHWLVFYIIALLLLSAPSNAISNPPSIVQFPFGGETFYKSDTINATYTTIYPSVAIVLICFDVNEQAQQMDSFFDGSPRKPISWFLVSFTDVKFPVKRCLLHLVDPSVGKGGDSGGKFYLLDETRAPTVIAQGFSAANSTSTSSTTSLATSTTSISSPTPGSNSTAETRSSQTNTGSSIITPPPSTMDNADQVSAAPASSELRTPAIAGISVAVAVVSIGIGAAGALLWKRRRDGSSSASDSKQSDYGPSMRSHELHAPHGVNQLASDTPSRPVELDESPVDREHWRGAQSGFSVPGCQTAW